MVCGGQPGSHSVSRASDLSLRRRQAGPQREIGLQDGLRPRLQLFHHLEQIGLGPAQPLHEGEPLGQAQVQAIDLLRHRIDLRLDSLDRPLTSASGQTDRLAPWRCRWRAKPGRAVHRSTGLSHQIRVEIDSAVRGATPEICGRQRHAEIRPGAPHRFLRRASQQRPVEGRDSRGEQIAGQIPCPGDLARSNLNSILRCAQPAISSRVSGS